MKKNFVKTCKRLLQMLLMASVLCMFSFVYADELIELEFGNEAWEEYMSYELEEGFTYEYDEELLRIEDNVLYPNTFGDTVLIVKNSEGDLIKEIEVIIYFVGDELTPFSPITINKPYISGYPDGSFRPKNNITRGEIAAVLTNILQLSSSETYTFVDLENHWSKSYLDNAYEYRLIDSVEGHMLPDNYVSRLEMANIIERYLEFKNLDLQVIPRVISDVNSQAASLCIQYQLMYLEDDLFNPNEYMTREEVVYIMNKLTCRQGNIEQKYMDVDFNTTYFKEINGASN